MNKQPATLSLIAINILIFAGMAFMFGNIMFNQPEDFYFIFRNGANFNPFTVGGEYWRLFTSMFIHSGIVHVGVNMYALYSIGRILESFLGTKRFILLYLITGICGGLASLYFNVYSVSVGASGAVFGLYGYILARQVLVNFRDRALLTNVLVNFIIFVVINYAISRSLNVDTAGHIGGFLSGALIAFLNFFRILLPVSHWIAVVLVLPFFILLVPKGQMQYFQTFQLLMKAEDQLQSVYNQLLTDYQRGDSLRKVTPLLDSISLRLDRLDGIPVKLSHDTAVLKKYTHYRTKEVNYQIMGIEKESFVYLDSIELIRIKLDSLPRLQYPLNYEPRPERDESEEESTPAHGASQIKVYYDSVWREIEDDTRILYFRLGMRDTLGRWQGQARDYYVEGNVQMKGAYKDGMHHGVFRYYTKDGRYEALGRYDNERPVGKWENYYKNGQIQSEVYYGDKSFTKNVWDSLGNPQVVNGIGKQITWHSNGSIAEEGEYRDGLKEGNWYGYHPSGKPHYQEFYRDNLLIRGVAMTEDNQRYVYDQLSVFPFPEMGMPDYLKYLEQSIHRTEGIRGHGGKVKLTFLVDTDGDIRDFVVTESLCIPCDREAIRLVKEGPPWRPGVLRGHIKIRSNGYVEVNF